MRGGDITGGVVCNGRLQHVCVCVSVCVCLGRCIVAWCVCVGVGVCVCGWLCWCLEFTHTLHTHTHTQTHIQGSLLNFTLTVGEERGEKGKGGVVLMVLGNPWAIEQCEIVW